MCLPFSRRLDHTRHWLGHTDLGRAVRFLLHRVVVVALTTVIAALIPEFELVISFVGSLGTRMDMTLVGIPESMDKFSHFSCVC